MKMEERDRIIQEKGHALGHQEGLYEGRISTIQSFIDCNRADGIPDSELLVMLQRFFQLSQDEATMLLQNDVL